MAGLLVFDAPLRLQARLRRSFLKLWRWNHSIAQSKSANGGSSFRLDSLVPGEDPAKIEAVLQAAAAAAMRMPRLETMEIWNGGRGVAALFQYQALRRQEQAKIVWRGTWRLAPERCATQAWEAVMHQYAGRKLDWFRNSWMELSSSLTVMQSTC
ncbi:hypothetical protein CHGG_05904 [Chaetomium globosum CBS 148.51]|uniref:DUF6546 domain-containing protein n=1 Tax=Chaetomium globosum (strain ATCC 6205 / CBS 148.51 / DSM 1962 / NBRC 6347 / NRRL 1970) TaxID=306901 RepID=Q2H611_CHAGB|nr:uncharacterized protein CHGG_05904 [Chaetomium globosum CBS 148.51]EAQ89285.1 hypothetical protein CHGG_05904 [Chaetomium globosum CBS 148.51]